MSISRLVGFSVVFIGLLSGGLLVAQPFIAALATDPVVIGVLFPTCTLLGLPLYAADAHRAPALRITAAALIGLGLFALLGLFVDGSGLRQARGSLLALWLVAPGALASGLLVNYFAAALERLGGRER